MIINKFEASVVSADREIIFMIGGGDPMAISDEVFNLNHSIVDLPVFGFPACSYQIRKVDIDSVGGLLEVRLRLTMADFLGNAEYLAGPRRILLKVYPKSDFSRLGGLPDLLKTLIQKEREDGEE